jgi:hypothetical protein
MASTEWCEFHHFGLVLGGRMHIEMADGTAMEVGPDAVYEIPPGHDAWSSAQVASRMVGCVP